MDIVEVALPRRKETVYEDREISGNSVIEKKCSFDKNSIGDKSDNREIGTDEEPKIAGAGAFTDKNTMQKEDTAVKRRDSIAREYRSNRRDWTKSLCEKPEEIVEESKKSKESLNIQELRRNWEKHSRGTADQENLDTKAIFTGNSAKKTMNLSKITRNESDVVDGVQESKKKQCTGKRAKDIEHLVNFFNCKNAEASKETARETWIKPRPADVQVVETPAALKKSDSKGGHEYSGYV